MTKKLEELFNLPPEEDTDNNDTDSTEAKQTIEDHREIIKQVDAAIDKIDAALPGVRDLDTSDQELDDLSDLAKEKFQDLIDLGMNVEARYSGRVFEVAGGMLKTSLDAKVAKLDKKIKMIDLQLKKEKMDKDSVDTGDMVNGEGFVVTDRNSLLERLKGMDKDK